MRNPILIELTRGALVESVHAGALAVVRTDGGVLAALGDVAAPVFPRSAIKPLQALPFVESGAPERFGFGTAEIALASASHSGTPSHTALVSTMLKRAGLTPAALACGVHEPMDPATARDLIRRGATPTALHHNCSGKHAGMLITAVHRNEPTQGYWRTDHPVQARVRAALENLGGVQLTPEACGIDGCSVPNWAMPLTALARAFARLATGEGLSDTRAAACRRIAEACTKHPDLVAGPGRLNTLLLARLPGRLLLKSGAEGVYCGALPDRGLGFAIKIDDGAARAVEAVVVHLVARFHPQVAGLGPPFRLTNWRGLEVGRMRASPALEAILERL